MKDFVHRPTTAEYYRRVLANVILCKREWQVDPTALLIFFGQSIECRGVRNNYQIVAGNQVRAYNGANHKPHGERGGTGFDPHQLSPGFTYAEVEAMMRACPDFHAGR